MQHLRHRRVKPQRRPELQQVELLQEQEQQLLVLELLDRIHSPVWAEWAAWEASQEEWVAWAAWAAWVVAWAA